MTTYYLNCPHCNSTITSFNANPADSFESTCDRLRNALFGSFNHSILHNRNFEQWLRRLDGDVCPHCEVKFFWQNSVQHLPMDHKGPFFLLRNRYETQRRVKNPDNIVLLVDDFPIKGLDSIESRVFDGPETTETQRMVKKEPTKVAELTHAIDTEEGPVTVAIDKQRVIRCMEGFEIAVMRAINGLTLRGDAMIALGLTSATKYVVQGAGILILGDPGPLPRYAPHEPSTLEKFRRDRDSVDWSDYLKRKGQL